MALALIKKYKVKMTIGDSLALLSCRLFSSLLRKKTSFNKINSLHMATRNVSKSSMDIVSVPPIVSTYRQAIHTFDESNRKNLTANLKKLKLMMDKLKAEDLALDSKFLQLDTWHRPNKAPCTYIEVFQNDTVNMSIFILKPGFKMPLHDHPHMHGFLKVISGAVNIKSYTEYPLTQVIKKIDAKIRAKQEAARLSQGSPKHRRFFAEISSDQICRATDKTCILTPTISNYHEIEALSNPAAFFDILSPPYDTLIESIGPRRCRYYKVANEISTNVVELQEIDAPDCFYCDQAPYLGNPLSEK